jgi:hypothetical protein
MKVANRSAENGKTRQCLAGQGAPVAFYLDDMKFE